ncbi:MAG: hypothetical protein K2L72_05485, partial [Clostridia bacterium]|nr:hypothetical protein [Clostridia bacterium]
SNITFYEWNDETKTGSRVFTIVISRAKVSIPQLIYTDNAYGTANLDGATITNGDTAVVDYRQSPNHYFNILGYDSSRMTVSFSNPNSMSVAHTYNSDYNGYVMYLTQGSGNNRVGTVTFTVSPDANHEWDVDDGSELSARQFVITVQKTKISLPVFEFADAASDGTSKTFVYDGTQQTATLLNASQSYFSVTVTGTTGGTYEWQEAAKKYLFKATNAGTYTLTLTLVGNVQWDDTNSTGTRVYNVIIERQAIEAPKLAYYGEDASYKAESRVFDSDTGFIHISYSPTFKTHYLTFEGYGHVTSTYFDVAVAESADWMTATWDNANNRVKLTLVQYNTSTTRDAGWVFYLTPKANYCWKTASSTTDFSRKTYTVYVDKLELELPEVYVEPGDNFVNNYKTVTYNGANQRISFLNFAAEGISFTATGTTNDWTTEAVGEVGDDGNRTEVSLRNFYAKNAGDYTITLSVANSYYYKWKNNAANPVYHFVIDRQEVEVPTFYRMIDGAPVTDPDDANYINQSTRIARVSYSTQTGYQFVLQNYAGSTFYTATVSEATLKTSLTGTDYFLNLAAGVNRKDYTLTVTPNANYKWKGEGYDAKIFTITVEQVRVSLLSIYDAVNKTVIEGNRYSTVYNGAMQNIVFIPTISDVNNNHFNFSTDVIAVYNTYAGNSSYVVTPSAGNKVTIDGVTVDSAYIANSTVGTYDYRIRLLSDNYVWDDGSAWNTYRQYIFQITPKEIPRLEYYYEGEYKADNTVIEEYSRNTRSVYVVIPEGSSASLNEYSVSASTSYFSTPKQTTYDGRPAYIISVLAIAPADRSFSVSLINTTNYVWQGESVTSASVYHFVVTKKILAEPVFNLVESAATPDDPLATKDTPISSGHAVEYTGNYYQIKFTGAHTGEVTIGNVSGAPALSSSAQTGASWNDSTMECVRTARDANTYTVRISVRYPDYYQWASGDTYRDYVFTINRKEIAAPTYTYTGAAYNSSEVTDIDGNTFSTVYTGANQYFKLTVDDTASVTFSTGTSNSSYKLTGNDSQWAASKYYYFYQSNSADYTVSVNLTANYC